MSEEKLPLDEPSNPLLTKPRTRTIEIYDGEVESRLQALDLALMEAVQAERQAALLNQRNAARAASREAAEAYDAACDEVRGTGIQITLSSARIGGRAARRLMEDHPPRKGHAADDLVGYNSETYPTALITAAIVDPVVTDQQVVEFLESLGAAKYDELWGHVQALAFGGVELPKFSAVSLLPALRGSVSELPLDTESAPAATTDGSPPSDTSTTTQPES